MYRKSTKKEEDPDKKPKLSYWSKTKCICPVCQRPFEKEEMLTGSGRMNAGDLTDELHRNYIPSEKYGAVYPLIYAIGACPRCHVALLWKDFEDIKDPASIDALRDDDENRKKKRFRQFSLTMISPVNEIFWTARQCIISRSCLMKRLIWLMLLLLSAR
jgi:uncharacterized protein (DUF2225 family)